MVNRREFSWFAGIRGTVFFCPRRFTDLLLRTRHNSVGAYTKSITCYYSGAAPEPFTIMAYNMHRPKGERGRYSTKDSRDELHNRLRGRRAQASLHCNCYSWMSTFTQTPVSPAVRYLYPFGRSESRRFSDLGYHVSPRVIFRFHRRPVFFLRAYHDSSRP